MNTTIQQDIRNFDFGVKFIRFPNFNQIHLENHARTNKIFFGFKESSKYEYEQFENISRLQIQISLFGLNYSNTKSFAHLQNRTELREKREMLRSPLITFLLHLYLLHVYLIVLCILWCSSIHTRSQLSSHNERYVVLYEGSQKIILSFIFIFDHEHGAFVFTLCFLQMTIYDDHHKTTYKCPANDQI